MANSVNARHFKFNNPHSSLVMARLQSQREAGLFCDVIIHVGSQSYSAHKNLLAANSLYFESIFLTKSSSLEKEVDAVVDKCPIHVTIDTLCVCPETFCAVLDYMYLGYISVESSGVTDVLTLAEEFYLDSLKDYCNSYLEYLRKSNTGTWPRDSSKRQDADHREITEETAPEDYFQDGVTSAIDELKCEIKIENDEPECDSLSQASTDQMPVMFKLKRKNYDSQNLNVTKRKEVVHEVPGARVVGNCEFTSNNQPNGKRNHLESQAVKKDGRKSLRKSTRDELDRGNLPRKTIMHHQLRVNLKSSRSNSTDISSESCQKLESQVDETYRPDLKIKPAENDVDISQDRNSPTSKNSKKRHHAELNDGVRKNGRSNKKSGTNGKIVAEGRFATRISCFWCSYKCQWKRELGVHVATLHFPEPPYNCDKCEETLKDIEELIKHKKNHSQWEKPFECAICKKLFKFNYALTLHMRCHTGERAFMCTVCGRSFTTKANLNEHILTHGDYRPFLCHLCTYSTKHQSLLTDHQRMHSGQFFHCEAPNCKYTATRRSKITSHMRCHLKVRPHVCSTCAKSFTRKGHLMRHERLHTNVRPFTCSNCPDTFSRAENLKAHRKKCLPEDLTE